MFPIMQLCFHFLPFVLMHVPMVCIMVLCVMGNTVYGKILNGLNFGVLLLTANDEQNFSKSDGRSSRLNLTGSFVYIICIGWLIKL